MANPFVSIDEQLKDAGFVKLGEDATGFIFVKHLGAGYVLKAECKGGLIQFYDPSILNHDAASVNEKELKLFAAKIKEWRTQNGRNPESGRHFNKERS